jgi:hypothetical protein
MPSQRSSVFTPAMGPRGPGYTVGLGSYLSGLSMPSWAGYAVIAALLGLASLRKIKWPLALMGAGAAWYFLVPSGAAQLVSGTGITPSGATIALNQAALSTDQAGNQYITQAGITYPVLTVQPNPSGGQTYFLDNPTGS